MDELTILEAAILKILKANPNKCSHGMDPIDVFVALPHDTSPEIRDATLEDVKRALEKLTKDKDKGQKVRKRRLDMYTYRV